MDRTTSYGLVDWGSSPHVRSNVPIAPMVEQNTVNIQRGGSSPSWNA